MKWFKLSQDILISQPCFSLSCLTQKHIPSRKSKSESEHKKSKKIKAIDVASVPVPKRRRSSSFHSARLSSSNLFIPLSASGDDSSPDSKEKKSTRKLTVENADPDLLVSCMRKNISFTLKHKGKRSDLGHNSENEVEEDDNLKVCFFNFFYDLKEVTP